MNAYCLIRDQPWYRRQAFVAGLEAVGMKVSLRQPPERPDKNTLLVIWNRYGEGHTLASRVEAGGGKVIVAENGYIGKGGTSPKFDVHPGGPQPHHYYSLSLNYHNGGGTWHGEDDSRFKNLGIELKPLRTNGSYILVCPNRSFGVPNRMMHPDWDTRMVAKLKRVTDIPTQVRPHPQNNAPKRALSEDLKYARTLAIWSSSCGVHALIAGIPVICEAPFWICKEATSPSWEQIDLAINGEDRVTLHRLWEKARQRAFNRLAWSQWTCEEITSGQPFRHLLPDA